MSKKYIDIYIEALFRMDKQQNLTSIDLIEEGSREKHHVKVARLKTNYSRTR